ncbi:hypothetical protein A8L34_16930 [Bacillus sp. FJAT-27264]|uniref:DUF917 domain-containing protein n=1 Tax=Paenibacillus sp. (strain DSM 101736 / FJAT-27264) TaxID=1850362 RepID=UPI0008080290|nr:DUF917 domain-containing protein [Bacillus sp. FJAT-27264]OBZ11996.1 hypothetical protein A8L34_16930 [Bacillus sp. FJAT-27264]
MGWRITGEQLAHIGLGANLLSSGGGGDTYTFQALAQSVIDQQGIDVVSFDELGPEDYVVIIGATGSAALCEEMIPSGQEVVTALRAYEERIGRRATAVMPLNIGGANALIPLILAAQCGLPVVDGDGMARTFPEVHMSSLHLAGVQGNSMAMTSLFGETVYLNEPDNILLSQLASQTTRDMGGVAYFAGLGVGGQALSTAIIPHTLSTCCELGRIAHETSDVSQCLHDFFTCFSNSIYGRPHVLIRGKIYGVLRQFVDGLVEGSFQIAGTGRYEGTALEIRYKNEYLSACQGDSYVCLTPDLLLVLDEERLSPCMVDEIEEGVAVTVMGIPAPNVLRTGELLGYIGPEANGIIEPYAPVEWLAGKGWLE